MTSAERWVWSLLAALVTATTGVLIISGAQQVWLPWAAFCLVSVFTYAAARIGR